MATIRDQIMQVAQSDPSFAQAIDAMEKAVINMPVTPEDLEEIISLLEFVVQNPDKYVEVRQAAIDDDEIDEDVLPPQFDMVYVVSLLVALYGLQDRLGEKGYARGGLTVAARRLAAQGRGGDSMLAHVNPREAEMLRRAGGSGGINPRTGLPEYKFKWGKLLAAAAPIVLSIVAPGIGTAIGTSIAGGLLGGTAAAGLVPYIAPALGGGLLGAGMSALTGGKPLQGAITGAIGSGLGNVIGQGINSQLGLGLGESVSNILGGTLVGSGAAAAQGRNPFSGALRGALGAGAGELAGAIAPDITGMGAGAGGTEGIARGVEGAGKGFGTALTAGMAPKEALAAGALSGLATGLIKPSQAVVQNMNAEIPLATPVQQPDGTLAPAPGSAGVMPDGRPAVYQADPSTGFIELRPVPGTYQLNEQTRQMEFRPQQRGIMETLGLGAPAASTGQGGAAGTQSSGLGGLLGGNIGPLLAGGAALMASQGGQQPQAAPPATRALPAAQQEYINRPGVVWDWGRMQRDATASNLTLDQFMARNWPRITSGEYNAAQMAQGGLSMVSRFVRGGGTGRSDEISAKLSDGEYVIDAETVAMLGDGSSKAGAKKLDEMREKIRQHKGKALSKGKFSPDAKSPLTYLKGVA